jgi:hypothetical protein
MAFMRFEKVTVTPDIAKQWLTKNAGNNRKLKDQRVVMYAQDMVNGDWLADSGEAIKFNAAGTLVDGQNRLHAVIAAGVAVDFWVAYDVPDAAMLVIDTGASRNVADTLKISGRTETQQADIATVVRWVCMWENRNLIGKQSTSYYSPSPTEVARRFDDDPGAFYTAVQRGNDCKRAGFAFGMAAGGVACYLMNRIDSEGAAGFFDQLISLGKLEANASVPERSPVRLLAKRLLRREKTDRGAVLAAYVFAWNAYFDDQPMDALRVPKVVSVSNFPALRGDAEATEARRLQEQKREAREEKLKTAAEAGKAAEAVRAKRKTAADAAKTAAEAERAYGKAKQAAEAKQAAAEQAAAKASGATPGIATARTAAAAATKLEADGAAAAAAEAKQAAAVAKRAASRAASTLARAEEIAAAKKQGADDAAERSRRADEAAVVSTIRRPTQVKASPALVLVG